MGFQETYEEIQKDKSAGQKNFNVKCTMLDEGMQTKVVMGASNHEWIIDSPEGLGGTDEGPSPLLGILGMIGSCIIAITKFWAMIMDIELENVEVYSRGKINLAGIFGIDEDELKGFTDFQPVIRVRANAPKEKVEELMDKVVNHCPVITNFAGATPIDYRVQIRE